MNENTHQRMDTLAKEMMTAQNIPGATLAVIESGGIAHARGYGVLMMRG